MADRSKKKKEAQFEPEGPYKHKSGTEKRQMKLDQEASAAKLRKESAAF